MIARALPGMADIDSSLLLFCKEIKKHCDVAISGECSDEVFAGYPWFFREDCLNSNTFPWSLALNERQNILNKSISEKISIKDYVDLYDILDRLSCWCCKNKNLWELYNIWYYFPDTYWKQLLELQRKTDRPFRQPNKDGKYGFTFFELQEKFENGYVPKRRKKIIK